MQVGLREVPVVIREVDDAEVMEIALVENLQRKDLTAFEEAEALQQRAENCGHTHEDLARKLGKSRTSITESLSLTAMPEEVRNLCRLADISAKSTLLQPSSRSWPDRAPSHGSRRVRKRPRLKPAFRPPTKAFDLRLSFKRST